MSHDPKHGHSHDHGHSHRHDHDHEAVRGLLKPGGCFLDYDHFDKFGGVPLHQHSMKVAGFKAADPVWHKHPTAVVKAVK